MAKTKGFYAQIMVRGRRSYGGTWRDEKSAGIARDRLRLYFGATPVEYVDEARALGPASPKELMRDSRRANSLRPGRTSTFSGVAFWPSRQKWEAQVRLRDGRFVTIGFFDDELDAARMRDRVVLHIWGDAVLLNFPSERTSPLSLEAARKRAGHRVLTKMAKSSSRFRGVCFTRAGNWAARITLAKRHHTIGTFNDEELAARAYDRAALFLLGPMAKLNFPGERLEPTSAEELRREGRATWKLGTKSRYVGVSWAESAYAWEAYITHGKRRSFIGHFDDEDEAALARDAVDLYLHGEVVRAHLNFPDRATIPRSVEQIRSEVWARFKETTSSEYTGVAWSRRQQLWRAAIVVDNVTHRLGAYDSQVEAARAYDRAARRLLGPSAFQNFPPSNTRTRTSPRSGRRIPRLAAKRPAKK